MRRGRGISRARRLPESSSRMGDNVPRPLTNEIHALPLIDEGPRVIKVPPAAVLAFGNIVWRSTAAFVRGNVDCCRFIWRRYEDVVDDDVSGINVLATMGTAIPLFETLARRELLFFAAAILNS